MRRSLLQNIGGGGGGGFLLDTYGGASAAYSLRYLSSAFVGNDVVLVRRSSDNSELGFTPTEITDGTLTTWVGVGNDGFVKTWYDQSGNVNDISQTTTTAQPQIVDNGSLILDNGKPIIFSYIIGSIGQCFLTGLPLNNTDTFNFFGVLKNSERNNSVLFGSNDSADYLLLAQSGSTNTTINSNSHINSVSIDGSSYTLTTRGALATSLTNQSLLYLDFDLSFVNTIYKLGYNNISFAPMYSTQEMVLYDTNQSANKTGIESNINAYYTIY